MLGLSPEQREAVAAPVGRVLVAAGAGVGKTEVLAARAVALLSYPGAPLPPERLLVVTFTEAAALEMRRRIEERLALVAAAGKGWEARNGGGPPAAAPPRPERLRRALIGTLHSFCLWLLRRHFDSLGLDPSLRVLEEAEAAALAFDCCERVLDAEAEALAVVGPALGGGEADERARVARVILRLHRFLDSVPDPDGWLAGRSPARRRRDGGAGEGEPAAILRAAGAGLAAALLRQAAAWLEEALRVASLPGGPAPYRDRLEAEREAVLRLGDAVAGAPPDWPVLLAETVWGRLPRVPAGGADGDLRELARWLREQARKAVERARDLGGQDAEAVRPPDAASADARSQVPAGAELATPAGEAEPVLAALLHLVRRFRRSWRAAKDRLGCLDFADLEHLALAALAEEGVAAAVRGRFGAVLVDEYQDVNPVQQAILDRLAGAGDLFLVGDARQSIYGFRHADPEGFRARHQAWSAGGGTVVSLRANRRSRPGLLAAVNFLFGQLEEEAVAEGAWPPSLPLTAVRDDDPSPPPVELHLVESGRGGDEEDAEEAGEEEPPPVAAEREALVVAARIRELVEGAPGRPPAAIRDPGGQGPRPLGYGDVAILLRAPRGRGPFLDALRRAGVPVAGAAGVGLPASPEVRAVLALLAVLDNPHRDPHLAMVLLSPLGGLLPADLADLALLRSGSGGENRSGGGEESLYDALRRGAAGGAVEGPAAERMRSFLRRCERWRRAARILPPQALLGLLYEETGLLQRVTAWPGGDRRRAALLALQERAQAWQEGRAGGLWDFVRFLLESEEGGREPATRVAADDPRGGVRVLSIHAAKGLEFPVVILADLGRAFDTRDLKGEVLADRRLGLGLRFAGEDGREVETPGRAVLVEAGRRRLLAEEMRLLYVGMTRARDRLILVGSAARLPARCRRWAAAALGGGRSLGPARVWGASSCLDWLVPAIARHPDGWAVRAQGGWSGAGHGGGEEARASRWEVRLWAEPPRLAAPTPEPALSWEALGRLEPLPLEAGEAALAERLGRRCDWVYPFRGAEGVPAKISVSHLAAVVGGPASASADEHPRGGLPPLRRPRFAAREGLTPAERGEAVHRFLRWLDLSRPLDAAGLALQRAEMVRRGFLAEAEAACVDVERLAGFLTGGVGGLLRAGRERVRREIPFYMRVPAAEVRPDLAGTAAGGDPVPVQGVMDAVLVDPEAVTLFEFKTGEPDEEELRRYRAQVRLYARAAEAIYARPVRAAWLCLLDSGRVLEVEVSA